MLLVIRSVRTGVLRRVEPEVQHVSRFYSIDDHGVVTFCRPADDEERGVLATLKARAADLNAPRRSTGEPSAPAGQSSDATEA